MSKHTKTDPACIYYKETGLFRRYLNKRGRGKSCRACMWQRNIDAFIYELAHPLFGKDCE